MVRDDCGQLVAGDADHSAEEVPKETVARLDHGRVGSCIQKNSGGTKGSKHATQL